MDEMTCWDNIEQLLGRLPENLTPLERVILSNEYTVQTLMSIVFGVPVKVEVLSQIEKEDYIIRWVRLVADYGNNIITTVCLAESVISKKTMFDGFLNGLREKNMGIGQLISSIGINTKREILKFYSDENIFSRTYKIISSDIRYLDVTITEVFQKDTFNGLTNDESNSII